MRSLRRSIALSAAAASLCLGGCLNGDETAAKSETKGAVIAVDASKTLGPVNRHAFGHNMESADSRGIFAVPFNAKAPIVTGQGLWDVKGGKTEPEPVKTVKELGIGMMRYPGGCLAHNYDWRQAAGPLSERPNWPFGIDEYIQLCRELGAEPLFTVTDYALPAEEMPQHAADLVEYLNSPATPDHPWAMKRKAGGHAEPYGVKWFELGNESDHGNHKCIPRRCFTPEEYVSYAVSTAAAMRKVDPSIKIGVVTKPGNGSDFDCQWNMAVYKGACPIADFLIVHFYGPGIGGLDFEGNFKSCMAYPEQVARYMASYRKRCKEGCGKDLPLAVTEYNTGNSSDAPIAYRYSFTAGLQCADLMRLWLEPSSNVANAEYWQVANGWWGMFYSKDNAIVKRRATLPFYQLWGGHFGATLTKTEVKGSPRFEAPAAGGLPLASGDAFVESSSLGEITLPKLDFAALKSSGVDATKTADGSLSFKFNGQGKEAYTPFSSFAKLEGESVPYKISFEARFIPDQGKTATATLGLSLLDSRGWDKTQSGIGVDGIEKDKDWKPYDGVFNSKADCPGVSVLLRFHSVASPLFGTLEVRNLKIETLSPAKIPAYQGLTAISSLSKDGKKLYLIVFNKSFANDIEAAIDLKGFKAASAESWTVSQEKVESINYAAPVKAAVKLPAKGERLSLGFPAHSMTAIDFVKAE